MKKCASCTKDLPDAALHCVFCGAKQPPAPATAGGMAKTVMGAYSASDMMDHLKQQGAPPPNMPAAAPYRPSPAPHQPPPPPAYPPPQQPLAPAAGANAKTMFAGPPPGGNPGFGGGPAPAGAFGAGGGPAPSPAFGHGGPVHHPVGTGPSHASSVPLHAPSPPVPPGGGYPPSAIPSAAPPYLASQTAARAGRPIEPWKDSLRMMMFIWGGALLVAFATPLAIDPGLIFNWDIIANAEGTQKLPPLIMAAVGILSLAIAGIPMSPAPRGMIAALLGLSGVLVPLFIAGMPPWQVLVPLAGSIILLPALFVRDEYRDASLPRILITVGVVASLAIYLIPERGSLPLVELFKAAIEAPGEFKVIILLLLAHIAIVVLCLLAWLPAPSSGGAKVFAWLLIFWPVILLVTGMLLSGHIDRVADTPFIAVAWVAGAGGEAGGKGAGMMAALGGLGVAYAVLISYGLATVVGKKLE